MDAQSRLLSVLSSHRTSLGPDDALWAFTNPATAEPVTEWVEKYLSPFTLLSFEESSILSHLRKTGTLKKLQPSTTPKTEQDLQAEIEALTESTELLKKQTEVLKGQRTAILNLRSRQRAEKERKKKLDAQRLKKWTAEKEEVQAAVEDLMGILEEEMADLKQTVVEPERDVEEVGRMLESDDRVLVRLEKLAGGLVVPDEGDGEGMEAMRRVEGLVEKLSRLSEQAIRTKLDRVYLGVLQSSPDPESTTGPAAEIQQEIDSLYSEISDVCKGSAYNEFLTPLFSSIAIARQQRGENWVAGGEYIQSVLDHLAARNSSICSHLQSSQSRDAAVLTLLSTIDSQTSTPVDAPTSRPSTPPNQMASTRRLSIPRLTPRASGSPVKLGRIPFLTPANHRRRNSDMPLSKSEHPDLALLAHLGITLPSGPHVKQQMNRVTAAQWDLETWEKALVEALEGRRRLEKTLRGDGYIPTRKETREAGGAMVLVDDDVRQGLKQVEDGVEKSAGEMKRLAKGVELVERTAGDTSGLGKKSEFVGRWGR